MVAIIIEIIIIEIIIITHIMVHMTKITRGMTIIEIMIENITGDNHVALSKLE